MCKWCDDPKGQSYCQDCGTWICTDVQPDSDWPRAAYVTSYGDVYCWWCGMCEQRDIDDMEEEEAAEWGWMDDDYDPYMFYGEDES